jgi:glycerol kinase
LARLRLVRPVNVKELLPWQSRVSAPICERLKAEGLEEASRAKTGLVLDRSQQQSELAEYTERHRQQF